MIKTCKRDKAGSNLAYGVLFSFRFTYIDLFLFYILFFICHIRYLFEFHCYTFFLFFSFLLTIFRRVKHGCTTDAKGSTAPSGSSGDMSSPNHFNSYASDVVPTTVRMIIQMYVGNGASENGEPYLLFIVFVQ